MWLYGKFARSPPRGGWLAAWTRCTMQTVQKMGRCHPDSGSVSPVRTVPMAELAIKAGACSLQGLRSNNEDRFVMDREHHVYLVADGMGGQEAGERASGLAAEIIPRVVQDKMAAHQDVGEAVVSAL